MMAEEKISGQEAVGAQASNYGDIKSRNQTARTGQSKSLTMQKMTTILTLTMIRRCTAKWSL